MKNFLAIGLIIISHCSFSQVGINVDNPNQMLHVDGKIKISTDGKTATPGTMRFLLNSGFEGYTTEGWQSFTNKTSPLPSNPVPLTGFSGNINAGFIQYLTLHTWDGTAYATVPVGRKFIITGIYPSAAMPTPVNEYYNLEFMADLNGTPVSFSRIRISGYDNETRYFSGDMAPILVLNEGERLRAYGMTDSTLAMNVAIRGFMVNDLDYD